MTSLFSLCLAMAVIAAACSSADSMSDEQLSACAEAARSEGNLGGSAQLVSLLVLRLPDDAISYPAGATDDEIQATFDRAFRDAYRISVDDFLALRDEADAATVEQLGEPPSLGEMVSDEWFVQRDLVLLRLWDERHPSSARHVCRLLTGPEGG